MKMDKFLSRKFAMTLIVVAIGVAVDTLTKTGMSATLSTFLEAIVLGFYAGNGVEHVTSALARRGGDVASSPQPQTAAVSPSPETLDKLDAIHRDLTDGMKLIADGTAYIAGHVKKVEQKQKAGGA